MTASDEPVPIPPQVGPIDDAPPDNKPSEDAAPSDATAFGRRVSAWLARRSYLTLAVAVQLITFGLRRIIDGGIWDYAPNVGLAAYGVGLFLPGPIKRGDLRQLAIALVLGPIAITVLAWALNSFQTEYSPLVSELSWYAVVVILVGVVEWLFRRGESWRVLAWIVWLGLGIAVMFSVVTFLPVRHSTIARYSNPLALICTPILSWLVIDAAYRIIDQERRRRVFVATAVALTLIGYVAFFRWGVYEIARGALRKPWLMDRDFAVKMLGLRGREDDYEAFATQLFDADWTRRSSRLHVDDWPDADWRATAVSLMIEHDPEWAAERLSRILAARPSRPLIDMTKGLFVKRKRWETVPILMRYALEESIPPSLNATVGQDRFKNALDDLRVPQTVHAWLIDESYDQTLRRMLAKKQQGKPIDVRPQELTIGDPLRRRLGLLLKLDAGPKLLDWSDAVDDHLASVPTPLPAPLAEETDRVVAAFLKYLQAKQLRDRDRAGTLPVREKVPEPNWDIPTTDAFCREIDDYVARVNAASAPEPKESLPAATPARIR